MSEAPIINRFLRLRKEVLDPFQSGLTFEGLVDALLVLFEHCSSQKHKTEHQAINEFITKFQSTVTKYNKLRISINDFDVQRIIGRGNFADVKLAKEKSSGHVYALKVMKKAGGTNSAFYEEERDIMARTNSPWLTKLDYAFQDNINLYLAMEFHAGGDMLSLLDRLDHNVDEKAIRFYLAEVALGIHDLHVMGYVHRDIKPENILLDLTGHVKIADFGSAARLNTSGLVTKVIPVGTPEYIAPEVLMCLQNEKGYESHGPGCDHWSLGILAFEMVFGSTPFSDLDGSVINTYSNIMAHKKVVFPTSQECSPALKNLIEKLLNPAAKRIGHKQIVRHSFFADLDWSNMKNHTPPHVPQVKGSDMASNFDLIEEETSALDTDHLTQKKNYKHLPFIGFTFTSDKGKLKSLESKESTSLETDLKTKAAELENYKLRIFQLEQQVFSEKRTHETSQREFEATEKLSYDLSMAENENTQLKTNIKNLERVLEVERQERSATEHKTLQVLQDVRKKWSKSEEEKLEKLRSQLKDEQAKSSELETNLSSTRRELKSTQSELESVKAVKSQLKNKLKDYKQRLENVSSLEEKRSEALNKLETENGRLKAAVHETSAALNETKSVEGKVDALQLIIEQRDQIMTEKNAELKIKTAEIASFSEKHSQDKKTIHDLETKFKTTQIELKRLMKDVEEMQLDRSEQDQVNTTVGHMKTELTEAITEISTLKEQLESHKTKEAALRKDLSRMNEDSSTKEKELSKKARELETELKNKEDEYKEKVKGLEKVFEKLQAKIDNLQSSRAEDVKEKSRKEVLEMEAKLHKLETELETSKRKAKEVSKELEKKEKENAKLKTNVDKFQGQVDQISKEKVELEQTMNEEKECSETSEQLAKRIALEKEVRDLKLDLRMEKREVEKKTNLVTYIRERDQKNKDKITELEASITTLEKSLSDSKTEVESLSADREEMERGKERLTKLREDLDKVKTEKLEMSVEKRRLETEISGFERKINSLEREIKGFEAEREKFGSLQINNDALNGLCVDLDRQVVEFETANEQLEDKVSKLEAEQRDLVSKLDSTQEEVRKCKIGMNEEKSVKLFAERKLKDLELKLEDQEKEYTKDKAKFGKDLGEYRDLCKKLSDTLEDLTGKNMKMEQVGNQTEKIKSHLELENKQLKEELSEKLTQLSSHKESNFKLTQGIEEAINKIEVKNKQLDDLQLKVETEGRIMSEKMVRHEATIAQQTKLVDFLQQKVGELEGRKKTFAEKLFANKENKPDNHLVIGYQDIQQQLQTERMKNRKLNDQLSRVRSEVVALKTSSSETNLPRGVLSQIDNKTATHNIPHRLGQGANKKSVRCPVCQETLGFMMLAQVCKDCGVSVHNGCAGSLPPTCGLSSQLISALQDNGSLPRSRTNSDVRGRAASESRKDMKDRPLPIPPQNTDKEGAVQVLQGGDWTEALLVLTLDNVLDVYEDASRNIRIDQISLTAPHCRVSVQSSVAYTEVYYVSATDRPYTFKLTVHTTGKSEKAVYLMCHNFAAKVEWVNRLEEVIKSSPNNLTPVPACSQEKAKELIAALPAHNEILSMDYIGNIVVIGTTKGLLTRDMDSETGELRTLEGIDVPVHKIKYIQAIQSLVLATGSDTSTGSQLVTVCARAVAAATTLYPTSVPEFSQCHIFSAHTTKKNHVYLCAANKHMVSIFEWSFKRGEFVIRNKFSTDKYTGCIYFTEHSVLVGTNKFYEIELKTFAAEEFLDTADPAIKRMLHSAEFHGSEPRQVLTVKDAKEPEFILCFTRHMLFVDGYGGQTREPITFSKLPMEHEAIGRIVASSFSDRILFTDLDQEGDKQIEKIEIFSPVPHIVGRQGDKIFYTSPGDAAFHLMSLDISKLRLQ